MPIMQTVLSKLNENLGRDNIRSFAKDSSGDFEHGKPLHEALAKAGAGDGPLREPFKAYLSKMPAGISEALRATIHHALNTTPPTMITFAWAPAYDYELHVWQSPDTETTKGGITVMFKSRYPDHPHPLAAK